MYTCPFLDIPPLQTARGTVVLPGSKSISNRVLLLAALSEGTTTVHDLLASEDTQVMLEALQQLGCRIEYHGSYVTVQGLGGQAPQQPAQLFLGNAGTAMRPLTAALALLGGDFELRGVARMHERPIGDLVDALRQLGCQIDYLGQEGFPPLRIGQPQLRLDAPIRVRGDVSSQFLTALLLALPLVAKQNITVEVVGELISKPYVEMTLKLLQRFGITVQREGWQRFTLPAGARYRSPGDIHVEADASSASYFIALGALAALPEGEPLRIEGVGEDSIQGDIRFIEAARAMGADIRSGGHWLEVRRDRWPLQAVDMDCNHIPDAAMTLAVMALYAQGTTTLRNIASWRVKETDRIAAMSKELAKLGAVVEAGTDFIRITPPALNHWQAASIHTYDDHRMAMCFSLAAFNPARLPVRIEDPHCVAKTFPEYFETLFNVVQLPVNSIPVICIDGPTASGKGTLAFHVAQRLGYHYLDSGSLYRATALAAQRAGIAWDDEAGLAKVAATLPVRFDQRAVLLNEDDVSDAIRAEAIGLGASQISAFPKVRQALLELQHSFRKLPGLVADGRDMGTVIFPDAPLKVYLTAGVEERAQRRHQQLVAQNVYVKIQDLQADLKARDARDSSRPVAPLKPAEDAITLDNSDSTAQASLEKVLGWWQTKVPFSNGTTPQT